MCAMKNLATALLLLQCLCKAQELSKYFNYLQILGSHHLMCVLYSYTTGPQCIDTPTTATSRIYHCHRRYHWSICYCHRRYITSETGSEKRGHYMCIKSFQVNKAKNLFGYYRTSTTSVWNLIPYKCFLPNKWAVWTHHRNYFLIAKLIVYPM